MNRARRRTWTVKIWKKRKWRTSVTKETWTSKLPKKPSENGHKRNGLPREKSKHEMIFRVKFFNHHFIDKHEIFSLKNHNHKVSNLY
jgi:hypothetical protein